MRWFRSGVSRLSRALSSAFVSAASGNVTPVAPGTPSVAAVGVACVGVDGGAVFFAVFFVAFFAAAGFVPSTTTTGGNVVSAAGEPFCSLGADTGGACWAQAVSLKAEVATAIMRQSSNPAAPRARELRSGTLTEPALTLILRHPTDVILSGWIDSPLFGASSIASQCLSEGHSRLSTWAYPQRHMFSRRSIRIAGRPALVRR